VAEIQKNIIERGRRNGLSRMFHAKNDKETIATWRTDLNRILHIFNVCRVTPAGSPLTIHFQTELAINTNAAVSDVHRNVLNTHTIVSDIHRTIVESQEGVDGSNRSVSAILLLYSFRTNAHRYQNQSRLVVQTTGKSSVSHLHLAHLESRLPHRLGLVSDVRI